MNQRIITHQIERLNKLERHYTLQVFNLNATAKERDESVPKWIRVYSMKNSLILESVKDFKIEPL